MKPFLHGKKSLSVAPLTPPPGMGAKHSLSIHGAHAPAKAGATPALEIVKEGDKVVRIIVACSCGERVEIECLYPAGS